MKVLWKSNLAPHNQESHADHWTITYMPIIHAFQLTIKAEKV